MSYLISKEELSGRLGSDTLLPIDTRGESHFIENHIPGAVNIPGNALLNPQTGLLKEWNELEELLTKNAVDLDKEIVIYDDAGLVPSSRLLWLLEFFGAKDVKLLDGGIIHWEEHALPLETGQVQKQKIAAQNFQRNWGLWAGKDEIQKNLHSDGIKIVDARSEAEYLGSSVTAKRNGHIPNAIHVNWEEHMEGLMDPRFKNLDYLKGLYESKGLSKEDTVYVYCRSGARCSNTYVLLKELGYPKVKNYTSSWLEWGNDDSTLIESQREILSGSRE
jgi:thiosulfate/3-mercaptopyruvate sulfurtransferase